MVRIDIAAQLSLAGRAPKVLLSGGALEGDVSEARGMAHAIRQQGVPETALILENSSRTTYENAAMTEDQLKARGIGKILLVTSALHMPRAMAAFAKQGRGRHRRAGAAADRAAHRRLAVAVGARPAHVRRQPLHHQGIRGPVRLLAARLG